MKTRTLDLATRIAEREWRHHKKSPNIPMPVIADVRAELDRLARRIRKLKRLVDPFTGKLSTLVNVKLVLDEIREAQR